MQVTLPIDVVIKSVRKRAGQHWIEVLASERQYRKNKQVYDRTEKEFLGRIDKLLNYTYYNYNNIVKSVGCMVKILSYRSGCKAVAMDIYQDLFLNREIFRYIWIGDWPEDEYSFYVEKPHFLYRKPERKVKHTKIYSNKLKELQELKRLGATEVTLTPEDEKFLDLTIDGFK